MGYVWCDGYVWDMCGVRYVWDMCGVRYANNLLKNPATKRLSGKKQTKTGIYPKFASKPTSTHLLGKGTKVHWQWLRVHKDHCDFGATQAPLESMESWSVMDEHLDFFKML